ARRRCPRPGARGHGRAQGRRAGRVAKGFRFLEGLSDARSDCDPRDDHRGDPQPDRERGAPRHDDRGGVRLRRRHSRREGDARRGEVLPERPPPTCGRRRLGQCPSRREAGQAHAGRVAHRDRRAPLVRQVGAQEPGEMGLHRGGRGIRVKLLLVHGLSLLSDLLGSPPAEHSPEEAQRAGESAATWLPGALAALSQGMDRVVVVGDGKSFRWRIDPQHTERPSCARSWRTEAWTAARRGLSVAMVTHADLYVDPPIWPNAAPFLDLSGGEALPLGGELAAARDVIATVAAWWKRPVTEATGGGLWPKPGSLLRIVSGRSTLAHLHDLAAGIEVVYDVRDEQGWCWRVREPSP